MVAKSALSLRKFGWRFRSSLVICIATRSKDEEAHCETIMSATAPVWRGSRYVESGELDAEPPCSH
eukprot:CAMPEP_0183367558 /NCGR_PEP_ID=MMETSP0164_2-20130417/92911_1 /TAXON_ID=221442 /ORGANISM="Coccolithus pelagicus ssp braarudi, Strain PLY182g" /LENGTH=65 /DNA_ID=CAMNT_0025543509 /DNA_START=60 /DNA_END=254 /DNA_ORIENTATION=+